MVESQQVLEWIAEGEVKGEIKGKIGSLLRLLERKFPPGPPAEVRAVIQSCTDPELWERWFDAAVVAHSLEEFQQALRG
jgi:hypothetical protein